VKSSSSRKPALQRCSWNFVGAASFGMCAGTFDEFGSISWALTKEDLLETLVGEIPYEVDVRRAPAHSRRRRPLFATPDSTFATLVGPRSHTSRCPTIPAYAPANSLAASSSWPNLFSISPRRRKLLVGACTSLSVDGNGMASACLPRKIQRFREAEVQEKPKLAVLGWFPMLSAHLFPRRKIRPR